MKTLRSQLGVTFLELMIVMAIIAMISAFAYPSYMRYVVKTKRTAAQTTLLRVADRQQQFFMDNKRYAANLTNLGFTEDPLFVSEEGQSVAAGDPDAVYTVSLVNVAATTYTVIGAPLGSQLERDGKCGTLTLDQTGARQALGGGDDCW